MFGFGVPEYLLSIVLLGLVAGGVITGVVVLAVVLGRRSNPPQG